MYTLEDIYKTFPSGCTEDYKILRAFEMGKQTREKRIADLEKENAELKERLKNQKADYETYYKSCYNAQKKTDKQLTKAKELFKQWLQTSKASGCDNINIVTDTEQFLSEVEK